MLTSRAGETLRDVHTVIIDEVHAVAATKRGAHLAVSLERLDALRRSHGAETAAQRIGLSATVRPIDEVARFLGGGDPVEIVAPPASKTFELGVVVPMDDMTNPPPPRGPAGGAGHRRGVHRGHRVGVAARRGGDRRPHPPEQLDHRLRELPPPRRTADRTVERDLRGTDRRRASGADRARRDDGAGRVHRGRRSRARQGPPRLGVERAACAGRGGAEVGRAPVRRRHEQLGARHRHGCRRPRDPGGGAAVRGLRTPARGSRRASGRRDQPRGPVPQAPRRRAAHRDRDGADAGGEDRGDPGAAESARHPRPADRRGQRPRRHQRRGVVRDRPPFRPFQSLPVPPTRPRSTCWPAVSPPTSSPSCGRDSSGIAMPARSPAARAHSGSRSPAAAPSPTAGSSASSWRASPRAPEWASSTRRWSTSPASATCSPWGPRAGASPRSPMTGSTSSPPTASRERSRSGTATASGVRSSWARHWGVLREVSAAKPEKAEQRLIAAGLDEQARANLLAHLSEQRRPRAPCRRTAR